MFVVAQLERKWTHVAFNVVEAHILMNNSQQVVSVIVVATFVRISQRLPPFAHLAALEDFNDVHPLHLVVNLLELAD